MKKILKISFPWSTNQNIHPAYECLRQVLIHYGYTLSYDELMQIVPKGVNEILENFRYIAEKYALTLDIKSGNFQDFISALERYKITIFSWKFENPKEDQVIHSYKDADHYSIAHACTESYVFFSSSENMVSQFIDKELRYYSYSGARSDFIEIGKIKILKQYILDKKLQHL